MSAEKKCQQQDIFVAKSRLFVSFLALFGAKKVYYQIMEFSNTPLTLAFFKANYRAGLPPSSVQRSEDYNYSYGKDVKRAFSIKIHFI